MVKILPVNLNSNSFNSQSLSDVIRDQKIECSKS